MLDYVLEVREPPEVSHQGFDGGSSARHSAARNRWKPIALE